MSRKLFCEISPLTYKISTLKCQIIRSLHNYFNQKKLATTKQDEILPFFIYRHSSLIRRKLGNVDMDLQENKAINLSLAAPKVSNIIIRPGETFSFWYLVGNVSSKKGYRKGLTISNGSPTSDIGGGMCQMTNLIHWMILHTPLDITEHHHHDHFDLFPDFNRQIPFGTGTSILYNYLDYRFKNTTQSTYQLLLSLTNTHLCGELRSDTPPVQKYHIKSENEQFLSKSDGIYRMGEIYRETIDIKTGNHIKRALIRQNHAKVLYDTSNLRITGVD